MGEESRVPQYCCTCRENSSSSAPGYLHPLRGLPTGAGSPAFEEPAALQGCCSTLFRWNTAPLPSPLCPGCCPRQCSGCIPLAAGSSVLAAGSLSASEISAGSAPVNKSFPGGTFHTVWGRLDPQLLLPRATSAPQPCMLVFPLAEMISQEDSRFEQFCMKTQGGEPARRRVCQTFYKPVRKFDFIFPSSVTLTR